MAATALQQIRTALRVLAPGALGAYIVYWLLAQRVSKKRSIGDNNDAQSARGGGGGETAPADDDDAPLGAAAGVQLDVRRKAQVAAGGVARPPVALRRR